MRGTSSCVSTHATPGMARARVASMRDDARVRVRRVQDARVQQAGQRDVVDEGAAAGGELHAVHPPLGPADGLELAALPTRISRAACRRKHGRPGALQAALDETRRASRSKRSRSSAQASHSRRSRSQSEAGSRQPSRAHARGLAFGRRRTPSGTDHLLRVTSSAFAGQERDRARHDNRVAQDAPVAEPLGRE